MGKGCDLGRGVIGIFDSGVGGFNALCDVRRALPMADILYLADRDNAPYGTKGREELIRLVKNDIKRLVELGADIILIACCTASSIYSELDDTERRISIPIIRPAARVAAQGKRISVIATDATVASHAFLREIRAVSDNVTVREICAQPLVGIVERMVHGCQGSGDFTALSEIINTIKRTNPDTLVLGCTHFSHLFEIFEENLDGVRIVSPAAEGARELILRYKNEKSPLFRERGRTVYL